MQQHLEEEEARLKQRSAMLQRLADETKLDESQKLLHDTINQQMAEIARELTDLRLRRELMPASTTVSTPPSSIDKPTRRLRPKAKPQPKRSYSDDDDGDANSYTSEMSLSMITITRPNGKTKRFGIGDFVAVEPDAKRPDDVGRIEEIIPEEHMCRVRWLYRYRDLNGPEAKKHFIPHTERDLQAETVVLSDHYDICSIQFIIRSVSVRFVGPKREYTCSAKHANDSGSLPVEFVCLQDYPLLASGKGAVLRSWTDGDIARLEQFAGKPDQEEEEEEIKPARPAKRRKKNAVATTTTTTTPSVANTAAVEQSAAKPPAVTADSKREEFIRLTKLQLESQVKANAVAPVVVPVAVATTATTTPTTVRGEEETGSKNVKLDSDKEDGKKDATIKEIAAILGSIGELDNGDKPGINHQVGGKRLA